MVFTSLKWEKMHYNHPPWLEKILKFTSLKWLKMQVGKRYHFPANPANVAILYIKSRNFREQKLSRAKTFANGQNIIFASINFRELFRIEIFLEY